MPSANDASEILRLSDTPDTTERVRAWTAANPVLLFDIATAISCGDGHWPAEAVTRAAQEMADSVVTAVIQAYLDSIAHDPSTAQLRPPSWVATVGGQKYGIDANHIYVAGLKIPTAILALLPIPGGNQRPIDHRLEAMAYDLRVAGARSANLQEFREAVRELRRKNEQDREYEANTHRGPSDTLQARVE